MSFHFYKQKIFNDNDNEGEEDKILMERGKRGRPKNDIVVKQYEDQLGRRLKMSKNQISLLKRRNYQLPNQDDDSIDIEDIVYRDKKARINFDNWNDQSVKKLHYQNYQTQQSSHEVNILKIQHPILPQIGENNHIDSPKNIVPQQIVEKKIQLPKKENIQVDEMTEQKLAKIKEQRVNQINTKFESLIKYLTTIKAFQTQNSLQQLCQRFQLSKSQVMQIHKEWKMDPKLTKFLKKLQDPLGPLINGKRQRTIQRIKEIKQLLIENPYLTQKQICEKLAERNPGKKKILLSAVLRLMRVGGFKKKRIPTKLSEKQRQRVQLLKKQFVLSYKQLCLDNKIKFYYLGQHLFHRHLYCDSYWSLQDKQQILTYSESFVAESIIMIAFLTPQGNLLWQARQGNYKKQDYVKLITKMMKKYCKTIHDVVIFNQNGLRDGDLVKEVGSKLGCTILQLPYKAQIVNPLEMFFANMKERVKKASTESTDDCITCLCEAVQAIKKDQLLELIQKSKQSIQLL